MAAAASSDGLSFGAPSVVLRSNWSAARMTHNLGVWREAAGGRHGGGYLFVGGQHNKASADERAGVWAVRTGVWFKHAWRGAAAASPEWLLDGHHPGCVERRRLLVAYMLPGVCEFDGRLSVVRHLTTGRYMMYARANAAAHGARFVMVATSADLRRLVALPAPSDWRLQHSVAGRRLLLGGGRQPRRPHHAARRLPDRRPAARLPRPLRLARRRALVAAAPLLQCEVYGERTAHHPAAGIVACGDDVWLYVHETRLGVVAERGSCRGSNTCASRRRGSSGTRSGGRRCGGGRRGPSPR